MAKDVNGVNIERGDEVHHEPTGEDWVVKRVGEDADGGFVEPAGWPPCRARASDCEVTHKGVHLALLTSHE